MLVHRRVAPTRVPPAGLRHLPHPLDVLLRVDAQDLLDAGLPGLEDRRRIVDTARPEQVPCSGDPRRRVDVDVIFDEPADREVETGPAAVVDRELLTPADR